MALDLSSGGIINPPIWDVADPSKALTFDLSTMATGTRHTLIFDTIASTNITSTFPNITSDTVVMNATAATLTNKTMTSNTNNLLARGLFVNSGAASVSSFAAAVPSANQVLKTSSTTTMSYVTQNLATTLVDGNSSGNTNLQMTGTGNIVLTTATNLLTSTASIALGIQAGNAIVAAAVGGDVNITGGKAQTTGGGGSVNIVSGDSPSGIAGDISLFTGTGLNRGFIIFQGLPYAASTGTPVVSGGGGATLVAGSTNFIGGISSVANGSTATLTFSPAMAAGKRAWVFLTLTGITATTPPIFRVASDSNTAFTISNTTGSAGVLSFNYWVIAYN